MQKVSVAFDQAYDRILLPDIELENSISEVTFNFFEFTLRNWISNCVLHYILYVLIWFWYNLNDLFDFYYNQLGLVTL